MNPRRRSAAGRPGGTRGGRVPAGPRPSSARWQGSRVPGEQSEELVAAVQVAARQRGDHRREAAGQEHDRGLTPTVSAARVSVRPTTARSPAVRRSAPGRRRQTGPRATLSSQSRWISFLRRRGPSPSERDERGRVQPGPTSLGPACAQGLGPSGGIGIAGRRGPPDELLLPRPCGQSGPAGWRAVCLR